MSALGRYVFVVLTATFLWLVAVGLWVGVSGQPMPSSGERLILMVLALMAVHQLVEGDR